MYGSNFCIVTVRPRSTSRRPSEAAAIPFPREETTPPVTKMYLVAFWLVLIVFPLARSAIVSGLERDPRPYRSRGGRHVRAVPPRCAFHVRAPATAPASPPPRRGWAGARSTAPAPRAG